MDVALGFRQDIDKFRHLTAVFRTGRVVSIAELRLRPLRRLSCGDEHVVGLSARSVV